MTTKRLLDLNLLSQAPYGAYAVDMNRIITFWNRSAERILAQSWRCDWPAMLPGFAEAA